MNLVIALLSTSSYLTADKIRKSVAGYAESPSDDTAQELASMRDQMAAMQKKLDELGK